MAAILDLLPLFTGGMREGYLLGDWIVTLKSISKNQLTTIFSIRIRYVLYYLAFRTVKATWIVIILKVLLWQPYWILCHYSQEGDI